MNTFRVRSAIRIASLKAPLWISGAFALAITSARFAPSAAAAGDTTKPSATPVVTDDIMGKYAALLKSQAGGIAVDRAAGTDQIAIPAGTIQYINSQIERMKSDALMARAARDKHAEVPPELRQKLREVASTQMSPDAMTQSSFKSMEKLKEMGLASDADLEAIRKRLASPDVAGQLDEQKRKFDEALNKEFGPAADPPKAQARPIVQNVGGLFDDDRDLANRKAIKAWLPKLSIRLGLKPEELRALHELETGTVVQKRQAAEELGKSGAYPAAVDLAKALQDPDQSVRTSAVDALGSLGDDAAAIAPDIVQAACEDATSQSRASGRVAYGGAFGTSAANALGKIGVTSVQPLSAALSNGEASARAWAIEAYARLSERADETWMSKDPSVHRREAPMLAALDMSAPKLLPLLKDESPAVRAAAASAVAASGLPARTLVSPLADLLSDKDRIVQTHAAHALGRLGPDAAVAIPDLIALLDSQDRGVAVTAVQSLGNMGTSAATALASEYRNAKTSQSKITILTALSQIVSADPTLASLLDRVVRQASADDDPQVRSAALLLLPDPNRPHREVKRRREIGASEDGATHNEGRRAEAVAPTTTEGLSHADELILKNLASWNPQDRASAVASIRKLSPAGKSAAVASVTSLLQAPDQQTQSMGLVGVIQLGPAAKSAAPALIEMLKSHDPSTTMMAATALGQIGPEAHDALPALRQIKAEAKDPASSMAVQQAISRIEAKGRD